MMLSASATRLGAALAIAMVMFANMAPAWAEEADLPSEGEPIAATILGPDDIQSGRTIILDASASRIPGTNVQYEWYVNDDREPISRTVDAIYTPERTGVIRFRLAVRATVDGQTVEDTATHTVTVFSRKVVLVSDTALTEREAERLRQVAESGATYLRVLRSPVPTGSRGGEERLTAFLVERADALLDAETVVLWTEELPTSGLYALQRAANGDLRIKRSVQEQMLLLITPLGLRTVARGVQGTIGALEPRQVLVGRPQLLETLLTSADAEQFAQRAFQMPSESPLVMDASVVKVPVWHGLSRLVGAMLWQGVSSQTIILLLVLPVIATILSFLKQVVGITTFGLFTPAIIALSFLALGWQTGLLFLLFILLTGYAARSLVRRLHILYIPKMAIILVIGSITLLLLVGIASMFGLLLSHDTIFVLLIMSTLIESFLNVKSEQGMRSAVFGIGQTILSALLCVALVQWGTFRAVILAYPELILLTIAVNILLGRYTGLRITEYFRFREVFKHLVQE